jgi:hypothetical protein
MSVSDDEESGGAVLVVRVQAVSGAASACVLVNERTTYQQLLADTDAQLAQQQSLAAVPSSSSPPNPAVTDTSVAAPAAVGVAAEENANAEKRENSRAPRTCAWWRATRRQCALWPSLRTSAELDLVSACARILSDDATSMVFGDRAAVARRAADVDAAMVVESALGRRAAGVRVAHDTTVAQFLTDVVDVVAVAAPTDAYAARLLERSICICASPRSSAPLLLFSTRISISLVSSVVCHPRPVRRSPPVAVVVVAVVVRVPLGSIVSRIVRRRRRVAPLAISARLRSLCICATLSLADKETRLSHRCCACLSTVAAPHSCSPRRCVSSSRAPRPPAR